jgi:hypothetical protein
MRDPHGDLLRRFAAVGCSAALDDARTEWVALGRPKAICRMMSVG